MTDPSHVRYLKLENTGKLVKVHVLEWPDVSRFKWYEDKMGYAFRQVRTGMGVTARVPLSRYINGTPDGLVTDHINGDISDYTRQNLRSVTRAQNKMNQGKSSKPFTSRFKGVSWHLWSRKWVASICVNGQRIHLGAFSNEVDAAIAYNLAAKRHFGEFARLNDVGTSALSGEGQKVVAYVGKKKPDVNDGLFE